MRPSGTKPRPAFGRWLALGVLLVALGLFVGPMPFSVGATGHASALSIGSPVITGKISSHGNFVELVQPGLAQNIPMSDGDLLFGDIIQIYVFDTHGLSEAALINYQQLLGPNDTQWANASMSLTSLSLNEFQLTVPSSTKQVPAVLDVDGTIWHFNHLTPLTLLPNNIFDIGGLDLVILATIIEFGAMAGPLTLLARWMTHKAIYAPHFSLLLWAHVLGLSLFSAIIISYQSVDQSLGGVSYLAYPVVFAVMWFLWSLHLFNRADTVEILKADTMGGHRLRFLRWTQLVGSLKDGRVVLIGPRWRDFIYALLGHFATLIPVESEATIEGRPVASEIQNRLLIPAHERKAMLRDWRPNKKRPVDDLEIVDSEKEQEPTKLYWVDSNDPVDVRMPHLTWHKWVDVPDKVDKHGVKVDAHREEKLTWPHVVDPVSNIRLAGIHYVDAPVAALGWSSREEDFKLLEKRGFQVYVLRSSLHRESERLVEERIAEFLELMRSQTVPLTPEQARALMNRSESASRFE